MGHKEVGAATVLLSALWVPAQGDCHPPRRALFNREPPAGSCGGGGGVNNVALTASGGLEEMEELLIALPIGE